MAIQDLLEYLSYSKCDCPIDYREEIGIVNAVCPNHSNSTLMVNGKPVYAVVKEAKEKAKKLAHKPSDIV